MPLLKINELEVEVQRGSSVLEAAKSARVEIPHYCYHPALSVVGSCRMCVVEVQGMPKLQVSCNTQVGELPKEKKIDGKYDMVVRTDTPVVKEAREDTLEFLLLNHPLDCPVCDQAGECYLQDYSFRYGRAHSRFEEEKRVRPSESLGSKIVINQNRCILCTRCVRFTREISGTDELFIEARGYHSKVAVLPDRPLDNLLAGNVADICPVGALLSTDYIHRNRIWNLTKKNSVCADCSVGCNVEVYSQDNRVYRVNSRTNLKVNGHFICDIGRYGYHRYENLERVVTPEVRKDGKLTAATWQEALREAARLLQGDGKDPVFILGSPFHLNEPLFLLGRLIVGPLAGRAVTGTLPSIETEKDITFPSGFRISRERSPNRRGMADLCPSVSTDVLAAAAAGKAPFLVLDDGVDRTWTAAQNEQLSRIGSVIAIAYARSPVTEIAAVVLPGAAPLEREGTMTNDRGRVQWMRSSLSLPGEARPDWQILADLWHSLDKNAPRFGHVGDVLKAMGDGNRAYSGLTLFKLGDFGVSTNGARPQ